MTASEQAQQVSRLRDETIAAIEQRDLLATEARRALIAALQEGRICRQGCADALTGWGLTPPPGDVTVTAHGQMSYTRRHADADEVRAEGRYYVPEELDRLLPEVSVWAIRVLVVALIPGQDASPGERRYRITAEVSLTTTVTTMSRSAAIAAAEARMGARLPALAGADIALTGLTWRVLDGPGDLIDTVEIGSGPAAVRLPDVGEGLTAVTAARDAAAEALADLRARIRRRAIRALVDYEIGGVFEDTAEEVEGFLVAVGLPELPRAHRVNVGVELRLRVRAATRYDAYQLVVDTVGAGGGSSLEAAWWTVSGWPPIEAEVVGDGLWSLGWRLWYEMSIRNATSAEDAAAAGEDLARAAASRSLAGTDHDLVAVSSIHVGFGIDTYLDPDSD